VAGKEENRISLNLKKKR